MVINELHIYNDLMKRVRNNNICFPPESITHLFHVLGSVSSLESAHSIDEHQGILNCFTTSTPEFYD